MLFYWIEQQMYNCPPHCFSALTNYHRVLSGGCGQFGVQYRSCRAARFALKQGYSSAQSAALIFPVQAMATGCSRSAAYEESSSELLLPDSVLQEIAKDVASAGQGVL